MTAYEMQWSKLVRSEIKVIKYCDSVGRILEKENVNCGKLFLPLLARTVRFDAVDPITLHNLRRL